VDSVSLDVPLFRDFPTLSSGHVWLVGAGPGDVGLLTLHALSALQQADVVYYDALISEDILKITSATLIYAGKKAGESCRQDRITQDLIDAARAGHRVVRLKGGDPLVFGRGGEEMQALHAAGIPCRIIPGVTAAQGAAACSQIPLTHRDHNSAVTFLSGHQAETLYGEAWHDIGLRSPLLVLYMGLKNFDKIRLRLLDVGRCPTQPVAFISAATTPQQKTVFTTLGDSLTVWPHLSGPTIIMIGEGVVGANQG
jgi:uroporphyrin-III C-methyltransferase